MEGRGVYNRSSHVQAVGLSPAVPLFEQAASAVPLADAPEAIVIADYGASEGRNSLAPMALATSVLRNRVGRERSISVVHTDQPGNDFSALFKTLDTDPESYLRDDATFASAVGRSFYRQLLPSESVTLGWCSWAVQWLSRTPALIPDHVQVAYSRDPAARAAYSRQAAEDWQAFLFHRSRELRPGARLVVLTMASTDDGDFGYRGVLDAMYAGLLALVDEGFLGAGEVRRMAIPTVGRSRADLLAPFSDNGRFADLAIEHAEVFLGDDSIFEHFERDRDAAAFGARWAAFSRASVFPTLALSLDGGSDDSRSGAFLDGLEATMAGRLAAAPQRSIIPLAKLVLAKGTSSGQNVR
jgi:hypothetical protein